MVQQYVGGSIQLAYVSTTHTEETPKIFMERQTLHNSVYELQSFSVCMLTWCFQTRPLYIANICGYKYGPVMYVYGV